MYKKLYYSLRDKYVPLTWMEMAIDIDFYLKHSRKSDKLSKKAIVPAWKTIKIDFSQDVNLVFFCGIGDALYGASMMNEIKLRCKKKGIQFNAFVSTTPSPANSPYLKDTLNKLDLFDNVYEYVGVDTEYWKYYQYEHAFEVAEKENVKGKFYPFLYKGHPKKGTRSQIVSTQFGMGKVAPYRPPKVMDWSEEATELLKNIRNRKKSLGENARVYLCHFDTRSGGYKYEKSAVIVKYLLKQGHIVLCPSSTMDKKISMDEPELIILSPSNARDKKTSAYEENLFILDYSIDLISLGHILSEVDAKIVAVNSVFWPLSEIFQLDILGLHYLRCNFGFCFAHRKMMMVTPQIKVWKKVENSLLSIDYLHYHRLERNRFMVEYEPEFIKNVITIWNARLEKQNVKR